MTAHDPRVTLTEAETALLHVALHGCESAVGPRDQAVERAVRQMLAARLAPIRALAEEWRELAGSNSWNEHWRAAWRSCAGQVEHALDAPVSASQDHDGAEGQGGCRCGHQRECHGPEVPGCVECRCLNYREDPR